MHRLTPLCLALTMVACAADPMAPDPPVVAGTWTVAASGLDGYALGDCGITGLRFTITQQDTDLTGTHASGVINCGQSIGIALDPGTLHGVVFAGDSVAFTLSVAGRSFRGTMDDRLTGRLTGRLTFRVPIVGAPALTLTGEWVAVRQRGEDSAG